MQKKEKNHHTPEALYGLYKSTNDVLNILILLINLLILLGGIVVTKENAIIT